MEVVKCEYTVMDNMLIVKPTDGIKDNSLYEIRFKNLHSEDGKAVLESEKHSIVTKMTPSYCKVSDVAVLTDTFGISESTILYYIREASKFADYYSSDDTTVSTSTSTTTTEEISIPQNMFVKTRVMLDCLLNAYVNKAASEGVKGTLGKISFENTEKYASNIDDLLDYLKAQLKTWQEALRGYEFEGRVASQFAKRGSKTTKNTTFADLVNDINREPPVV